MGEQLEQDAHRGVGTETEAMWEATVPSSREAFEMVGWKPVIIIFLFVFFWKIELEFGFGYWWRNGK